MAFLKPTRLERDVAKFDARLQRERAKDAEDRAKQRAWSELSREIAKRDGGRCRVCGIRTGRPGGDPRLIGAAHHITYKSAGGRDTTANLIWICGQCHAAEHQHQIVISGNGDQRIDVTQHDVETNRVVRAWESRA
jgi:5-methylcytosine-specific restriction endonuclease McrA